METHQEQRQHPCSATTSTGILTIDLSAIEANWRRIAARLAPGASAGAVIKANAYGLGAAQVGSTLYRVGCREFFVASLAEACEAQQHLPGAAKIIVLGGARPGDEAEFMARGFTPVLFDWVTLTRWRSACRVAGEVYPAVLKVDTGMHRLGLTPTEVDRLIADPACLDECGIHLLMSHLACADEPDHSLNQEQLQRFQRVADRLRKYRPGIRLSLANSSGIFLGHQWHYDLVRPGAALYGFNPQPDQPSPMLPVVQLDLPVLQVREVSQSGIVGYGASASVEPPARLAVVAGGYADGLNRTLGRQPVGAVGKHATQVIGRVSMDLTTFDISALPADDTPAWIQVVNRELTVDHLTQRSGALGYEVLTSLGQRYQRRYLGGAESD